MSAQGIRLSISKEGDTSHELVSRLSRLPVDSINNDIGRGLVQGAEPLVAFGQRIFVGAVTDQIIWSNGDFIGPVIGGAQMSVVSTSADDASGGTGLRTVEIHYLTPTLQEKTEIITLNGTSAVLTQATDIYFINLLHVETFGSGKKAAGDITVSSGGNIHAEILTGNNVQFSSARMVPAGKVLRLAGAVAGSASSTSAARVTVKLASNAYNGLVFTDPFILLPIGLVDIQDNTITYQFPIPSAFPAGSIICLMASSDKACNVSGSLYGWTEDA